MTRRTGRPLLLPDDFLLPPIVPSAHDYLTIASNSGYALWQPVHVASLGWVTKVLPTGSTGDENVHHELAIRLAAGF